MLLALLLASAPATVEPPADAPVVTHTAILETPEHTFVARGEGLWLPKSLAIDRAEELRALRYRLATQTVEPTPLGYVIALGVGVVLGLVGGGYVAVQACRVTSWCR